MIARKLIATIAAASSLALAAPAAAQLGTAKDANPNKPGIQEYGGGGPGNYSGIPSVYHQKTTRRPNGGVYWGRAGVQICKDLAADRYRAKHAALWVVTTMIEHDTPDWQKRQFTQAAYQTCTARDWQRLTHSIERIGENGARSVAQ